MGVTIKQDPGGGMSIWFLIERSIWGFFLCCRWRWKADKGDFLVIANETNGREEQVFYFLLCGPQPRWLWRRTFFFCMLQTCAVGLVAQCLYRAVIHQLLLFGACVATCSSARNARHKGERDWAWRVDAGEGRGARALCVIFPTYAHVIKFKIW